MKEVGGRLARHHKRHQQNLITLHQYGIVGSGKHDIPWRNTEMEEGETLPKGEKEEEEGEVVEGTEKKLEREEAGKHSCHSWHRCHGWHRWLSWLAKHVMADMRHVWPSAT